MYFSFIINTENVQFEGNYVSIGSRACVYTFFTQNNLANNLSKFFTLGVNHPVVYTLRINHQFYPLVYLAQGEIRAITAPDEFRASRAPRTSEIRQPREFIVSPITAYNDK